MPMKPRGKKAREPDADSEGDRWRVTAVGILACIIGLCMYRERGQHLVAPSEDSSLLERTNWQQLNETERAALFISAAAAGQLGEALMDCAIKMRVATFRHGDAHIRGAAAASSIHSGFVCSIGEAATLSAATVREMLGRYFMDSQELSTSQLEPLPAGAVAAAETLKRKPVDDRALLAVLLLRERGRKRSPLMPYVQAFLSPAEPTIPTMWDPKTPDGALRRATFLRDQQQQPQQQPQQQQQSAGGSGAGGGGGGGGGASLLRAVDMLRREVEKHHEALIPRALARVPSILSQGLGDEVPELAKGGESDEQGMAALRRYYSVERFTEMWANILSRDFVNGLQERSEKPLDRGLYPFPTTFLVPLADLMNHGGPSSNVEVSYDARRRGFVLKALRGIRAGEEMRFSYAASLCRQQALLRYGFADREMPECPALARRK